MVHTFAQERKKNVRVFTRLVSKVYWGHLEETEWLKVEK